MKRIILLASIFLSLTGVYAQKGNVTGAYANVGTAQNPGNLQTAKDKIDAATVEPTTAEWAKTYYVRGRVYQAIAEDFTGLYKNLDPNATYVAYDAYLKSVELSKQALKSKDDFRDDIAGQLPTLKNDLINKASEHYSNGDYASSSETFEKCLLLDKLHAELDAKVTYTPDTIIYYYTGLTAYTAENYERAITFLEEAAKLNYGINVPDSTGKPSSSEAAALSRYIYYAYVSIGDTAKGIDALITGIRTCPNDNNTLIVDLVNHYLRTDNTAEALKYIDQAIDKEPTNGTFYFAKGTLYDKAGDFDQALVAYKKAIELNPVYYDAYYNTGALFYNKAAGIITEAQNIPPNRNDLYDAELIKANAEFEKAMPYLEKAHELEATDKITMETLKTIYVKLNMMDTQKYKDLKAALDAN